MDLVDAKLEPPHLQRNAAGFQTIRDIAAGSDDGAVLMINMNGYYREAGYPYGESYQAYVHGPGPFLQGARGFAAVPHAGLRVHRMRGGPYAASWQASGVSRRSSATKSA